jgi:hypothetical protein
MIETGFRFWMYKSALWLLEGCIPDSNGQWMRGILDNLGSVPVALFEQGVFSPSRMGGGTGKYLSDYWHFGVLWSTYDAKFSFFESCITIDFFNELESYYILLLGLFPFAVMLFVRSVRSIEMCSGSGTCQWKLCYMSLKFGASI